LTRSAGRRTKPRSRNFLSVSCQCAHGRPQLFFLNGFGYAVDSLILLLQSITSGQAALEFRPSFAYGLTIAAYVGMLAGALFWGLGADIIGRKIAFKYVLTR
jgi:MFS family permease